MNYSPFQDWSSNRGNPRSQLVLLLFRIAQCFHRLPVGLRWAGFPYLAFYELLVVWMLGIELSYKASIGPGLRLFHGVATVIHESVVMGKHCTLRHSTTIGMRHEQEAAPILGDNVDVGCQSVIIGPIRIGNGVTIGAGSVVLDNLPNHAVAVGNPARILKPVFKVAAVDDGEEHDLTGVGRANCLKQLEGRANLHQAIQPTGLQSQSVYEILEETIPTSAGMTFDTTQSIATAVDVENRFL